MATGFYRPDGMRKAEVEVLSRPEDPRQKVDGSAVTDGQEAVITFLRDLVEGRRDLRSSMPLPAEPRARETALLINRFVQAMVGLLRSVDDQTNRIGVGAAKNIQRIASTAKEQHHETEGAAESLSHRSPRPFRTSPSRPTRWR